MFFDGLESFSKLSEINTKGHISVFYIDEFGMEEMGIDQGGIFKEFMTDLSKIVFDPGYGMFTLKKESQELYPNPLVYKLSHYLIS